MPFYKRNGDELLSATFVQSSGFTLAAETRDSHAYPVDGWYWFDTLDAALQGLATAPAEQPFIKKWQLLAGFRQDGLYADAMAFINSMSPAVLDLWAGSAGVERDSPFIPAFQQRFALSEAAIDSMFARYTRITQADVAAMA